MRSTAALALLGLCAVSMVSSYSARYYRSSDINQPKDLTPHDLALANVSHVATATKMDVLTNRLDEAAQSADQLKLAAKKAEEKGLINREDAAEIKKTADQVKKAVERDDQATAIQHLDKLEDHLDNVAISQKGDEVASKLKKADAREDKPVLSTPEDMAILRAAVADVVQADPLVPPEKKAEATDFAVKMIKDGFEKGNVTQGQLIHSVETDAAKNNMTNATLATMATDRDWDDDYYRPWWYYRHHRGRWYDHHGRWWDHDHGRWFDHDHRRFGRQVGYPGYYDPYYYYGYGYNSCLYWSPYSSCLGNLFGDYAFYHGFHHFFHHHGRHWGK